MKLYVCYGTFRSPRPGGHPCRNAHEALLAAGHEPELVKSYGLAILPDAFNQTAGRKRARELTGKSTVPVLELDDGTGIGGSQAIIAWAEANPA
ncbi:MAG TPA: glutathione S-transferase N-terminal domain-containing protein [Thermoleophilaceae bacterium]|nr:glutathione S-transferase N-terminal domain-containing protein [Thermoleophilaceae bacterium]